MEEQHVQKQLRISNQRDAAMQTQSEGEDKATQTTFFTPMVRQLVLPFGSLYPNPCTSR
jgi:hypothetical protein